MSLIMCLFVVHKIRNSTFLCRVSDKIRTENVYNLLRKRVIVKTERGIKHAFG